MIFISVNDRADKSIEALVKINFLGRDGEKLSIDTGSLEGRKAYQEMWKENRTQLYALTSKYKIPLIELTTESDIQKDLPFALKTMVGI